MEASTEPTSFNLLIATFFCFAESLATLFVALRTTGISTVTAMYIAIFSPLILLPILIYSYAKNKNPFFKRFCYAIILLGIPWVLMLIAVPISAIISSIHSL